MPNDDDRLDVLSGLAMFADEGEDGEGEGAAAPRLPGGSRPVVSSAARRLIQEAHEEPPSSHGDAPAPPTVGEGASGAPRRLPGQPTARGDIAQAARTMGPPPAATPPVSEDSRSPCAKTRARFKATMRLNEEALALMEAILAAWASSYDGEGVPSYRERIDEWDERRIDALTE